MLRSCKKRQSQPQKKSTVYQPLTGSRIWYELPPFSIRDEAEVNAKPYPYQRRRLMEHAGDLVEDATYSCANWSR